MTNTSPPPKSRPSNRRRGAAAVEFAMFAPVFVILIMGTLGATQAMSTLTVMSEAVREGGRLGANDWTGVLPAGMTPNMKVEQDVRAFLSASGVDPTGLQVSDHLRRRREEGSGVRFGQKYELRATLPNPRPFRPLQNQPRLLVSHRGQRADGQDGLPRRPLDDELIAANFHRSTDRTATRFRTTSGTPTV